MQLKALLNGLDAQLINPEKISPGYLEQDVELLTLDSRKVRRGVIFVASRGATPDSRDGHEFIGHAQEQQASAIIIDDIHHADHTTHTPIYLVKNSRATIAKLAEKLHGYPSRALELCGVTGTNGKTTVTFLTASIMGVLGKKSGVLGTLGAGSIDDPKSFGYTTPEAEVLSALLGELRDEKFSHITMEVSSHALATRRSDGLTFKAAAFTNLSVDHLDFHGDMETYREAKDRLFLELLPSQNPAILPEEHPLVAKLRQVGHLVFTWGFSPKADIRAREVEQKAAGLCFNLEIDGQQNHVQSQLFGLYNVDNMLCAAGLAYASGASVEAIAKGLALAAAPPGRLERVQVSGMHGKPAVFVDFAHTPDALERTLGALRPIAKRRLIVVFGCGGNRDKSKRPQMGRIATTMADLAFVTDDNPRHEKSAEIIRDILAGIDADKSDRYRVVPDRHKAIVGAIKIAQADDIVLLAGKGHEKTQQIGDDFFPFQDLSVAKSALEEWHL